MHGLTYLTSDPLLIGVAILVVAGAAAVHIAGPRAIAQRVRWLRGVWIVAFLALAMWGMRQEQAVRTGAAHASTEAPVAVTSQGATHYVSEALAFRRDAALWVILAAGLGFALIEMWMLRQHRESTEE